MGYSAAAAAPPPLCSTNPCRHLRSLCPGSACPLRPSSPFWSPPASKQRSGVCVFSSPTVRGPVAGDSWWHARGASEELGGWWVKDRESEKKDFPRFLAVGIGTSVAALLAAFVHVSSSRKGYKLQFNMLFHALHGLMTPLKSGNTSHYEDNQISVEVLEDKPATTHDPLIPTLKNDMPASTEKKRIVHVVADSTQQQALFVLKKLKIIEDDVKPHELCTRREYARWLVKANTLLERNPKHKISLSVLIGSTTVTAFDDVNADDPDFWCIQALGEVGIAPCKLLAMKSDVSEQNGAVNHATFDFEPESFLSRLDLVNWRAQLEYLFTPGVEEKMLWKNMDFMDVAAVGPDASSAFFMDILAEDTSIARKVFGNIRRLQPHRPATKAQAAVALASGRMAEAIQTELSNLEAENVARFAELEDIQNEIIRRGDIQRFWEEKVNAEKIHVLESQNDYLAALNELNEERMALDKGLAAHMKEKAALDCQKQLLVSLKEEIEQLQLRLTTERINLLAEQESLEKEYIALRDNQDAIAEAKSILEVEKEALQILRSWVEEGARKSELRAKVLESAAQRWRWDNQSSQTSTPENTD